MELNEDLAYFLGVIGGDGTIYIKPRKQYFISITDKCEQYHENILKEIIFKIFSLTPTIIPDKRNRGWYTIIRSKKVAEILTKEFGYSTGRNKTYSDRIPTEIFKAPKEIALSHIAGWIDSEGTSKIKKFRKKYIYPCIVIELVNKKYLEDLHNLSKIVGVASTKPIFAKRKYRSDQKPRYFICWNGLKKCRLLFSFMKHPEKKKFLEEKIFASSSRRPA